MVPVYVSRLKRWRFHSTADISVNFAERLISFPLQYILSYPQYYYALKVLIWVSVAQYAVKRKAVGIWGCKDCGKVKAGGAYTLKYCFFLMHFFLYISLNFQH